MSYGLLHNEIFRGQEKVAWFNKGGKLVMGYNHSDLRDDIEDFLAKRENDLHTKKAIMTDTFSIEGDEIFKGDVKVAYLTEDGALRMTPHHGELKPEVAAWLDEREKGLEGAVQDVPKVPTPPSEHELEKEASTKEAESKVRAEPKKIKTIKEEAIEAIGNIVCPIEGSPQAGDKDPAVINWWFENHPEIAEKKYKNRRYQLPTE